MLEGLVVTCVLAINTPSGEQICIKPDGNVEISAGLSVDRASRMFWEELAKTYRIVKQEKCI